MAPIEMRRRSQRDEELAAVRIRTGIRHRQHAGTGVPKVGMKLVSELITGPAVALPQRITTLQDKAVNDPMENDAVVERLLVPLASLRMLPFFRAFRQADEVGDRV